MADVWPTRANGCKDSLSGARGRRARCRASAAPDGTARTGGAGAAGVPAAPAEAGSAAGLCCPGASDISCSSARRSKVAFEPRPKSPWSRRRAVSGKAAYETLPGNLIQCRHAQASRARSKSDSMLIAWEKDALIVAENLMVSGARNWRIP